MVEQRAKRLKSKAETEDLATGSGAPGASERTLEQAIGLQVRQHRKDAGLTVSELATAANISSGMLSKIENGQISPSLGTLQTLALALNVPITLLFAGHEERRDCSYVKSGEGVVIRRRGTKVGHQYQLLGHSLEGDTVVEPYLITLAEDAAPYSAFQHEGVEFIYMISGQVEYVHADRSYILKPGDAILFDSAAPHGPEKLIKWPISYLSIIIYPRR
ncbi:MAG: helix-turn-helix domain-containing protein [Hyphomicrobium sp.]